MVESVHPACSRVGGLPVLTCVMLGISHPIYCLAEFPQERRVVFVKVDADGC